MLDFRKSLCLGVALFVLSAPVLACALPGQEMSEEEQACCLHMADECGSTQMESHPCCNKLPQTGASVFQVSNKYTPVTLDLGIQVEHDLQTNVATAVAAVLPRVAVLRESPPGQPSVLRI